MDHLNNPDQALQAFADLYIDTPRHRKVNLALEESMHLKRRAPNVNARNLVITSEPGMGKSYLLERFMKRTNHVARLLNPNATPVIYFSLSDVTRPKDMSSALIKSMGDPFAGKSSHSEQMDRAFDLMDQLEVEVVLLDEFSHILLEGTEAMKKFAQRYVKDLVNRSKRTIVLAGLKEIEPFVLSTKELRRRFIIKLRIPRYRLNKTDSAEFRNFMQEVEDALPLPVEESFTSERMILAWYCMSGGIPDYVMKPLTDALSRALDDGLSMLTLDVLATAAEDYLDPDGRTINPFTSTKLELIRAVKLLLSVEQDVTRRFDEEFEQIRFPWLDEI